MFPQTVKSVSIGERRIGPGEPVFIVVETGTTYNGDLEAALKLVDAAKEGGRMPSSFNSLGQTTL